MNKQEAELAGANKYIGKPCPKGHSGLRYTKSSVCVECVLGYVPKTTYKQRVPKQTAIEYRAKRVRENLLNGARNRAARNNVPFNLTLDDIQIPDRCPVFGTDMVTPSLDRFDPNKGYTKGNVRVISLRANQLKNNATIEQLEAILKYMKSA